MATLERLLTAEEAHQLLGVSLARLYWLVRNDVLPAVRLGRQVRFSPHALERFIESGGAMAAGPPAA